MASSSLPPDDLIIEITETSLMSTPPWTETMAKSPEGDALIQLGLFARPLSPEEVEAFFDPTNDPAVV